MAKRRAKEERRCHKAANAAKAKKLVHASSSGAHQRVSPPYIAGAPVLDVRKTMREIGAKASSAQTARRRKSFCKSDRKSTRLNSSHRCISYAVFCLKKK